MIDGPKPTEATPPPATEPRERFYVRPNPRIIESAVPALAFIVANQFASTEVAIAASFLASVVVFVRNRGHGVIRALGVAGFFVVCGFAVLGLVLGSGKVFVAQNLFIDFMFAAAFIGSVLIGRPLLGAIVREVAPALQPVMPLRHPLFVRLTLLSALLNVITGVARIGLLMALTENQYVIASRALGFPISVAFYIYCYVAIQRTAIRIWPADLPPPNRDGTPS
jgi:hypothetical protein